MRLLDTSTLTLHTFFGSIPRYAILSHRWDGEEVTYQDLLSGRAPENGKSFYKICGCCRQAAIDGWKRGWTLQELLAPNELVFYDREWEELGTKRSLRPLLSSITGISSEHLYKYRGASVAQKMSWTAHRGTTRVEDRAYSLMGLFEVNMPPLYGEGTKAFRRLQLQILESSDDESLFAWTSSLGSIGGGLLADSPSSFAMSGDIVQRIVDKRPPYSITNKGMQIDLTLISMDDMEHENISWDGKNVIQPASDDVFSAPLNCAREGDEGSIALIVFPKNWDGSRTPMDDYFAFQRTGQLVTFKALEMTGDRTLLYFKQKDHEWTKAYGQLVRTFQVRTTALEKHGFHTIQKGYWRRSHPHKKIVGPGKPLCGNPNPSWALPSDPHERQRHWNSNGNILYFKFTAAMDITQGGSSAQPLTGVGDNFVVIVELHEARAFEKNIPTVSLLITPEGQSLELDIEQDNKNPQRHSQGVDRTSGSLRSGRSVSASLKTSIRDKREEVILDITIDPEGRLPWPTTLHDEANEDEVDGHDYLDDESNESVETESDEDTSDEDTWMKSMNLRKERSDLEDEIKAAARNRMQAAASLVTLASAGSRSLSSLVEWGMS